MKFWKRLRYYKILYKERRGDCPEKSCEWCEGKMKHEGVKMKEENKKIKELNVEMPINK